LVRACGAVAALPRHNRLALLIRPEFIDPDNFGTSVALNHGLAFRGFVSEARAMDWLLGRRGGG
jgi:hypothetical protein